MLLSEALRDENWRSATAQVDRLAGEEAFAFMAPLLRAWIAFGSRRGDPIAILDSAPPEQIPESFAAENRALLLLARNRPGAAEQLASVADQSGIRGQRLRIAGAALLARRGDRREALALLQGDGPVLAAARRMVEARRPIPGEIASARAGVAEFLARLSIELNSQDASAVALSFARIATLLAPENSEASLIVAELLLARNRHGAALAAVGQIQPNDPFWIVGRDLKVRILHGAGRREEAVALARAAAEAEGAGVADWRRLGDLYLDLQRDPEAVAAYQRAIALAGEGSADNPLWALLLTQAAALERSGDWTAAKAALERARTLAPDQPQVLNDLGYLQLERRENVEQATRLVAEAHRLAPDSAAITDSLGWAYYLQGDLVRAIDLLERAAEREPADPEINEHLGDAYYRAGRRIEARFAWRAALVYAEEESAARLRAKIDTGLTPSLAAR